jgi:hypothetical protein
MKVTGNAAMLFTYKKLTISVFTVVKVYYKK